MTTVFLDEVFTAGGIPTHTYVERDHGALKADFESAIRSKNRMITLHGPTKSGKTVLVARVLDGDAVVVDGGSISSEDDFWYTVALELNGWTSRTVNESSVGETVATGQGGVEGGLLGVAKGKASASISRKRGTASAEGSTLEVSPKLAALGALKDSGIPLVIDDFHYLPDSVRRDVVRALKGPISRGLPVVVITVSHRALDAVNAETDMRGRVHPLKIPEWTEEEMKAIGDAGFRALNVNCERLLLDELVANAFGSPHLMQAVCHELCAENNVRKTQTERRELDVFKHPQSFFRHALSDGGSTAFERLCLGPHSGRKARKQRRRRSGGDADVYEAVLEAIKLSGPKRQLEYGEIREWLGSVLDPEDMPRKNEITNALRSMGELARDQIDGEPVLDWNAELETLHIADPFFRYHLKWHADFNARCGGRRGRAFVRRP